jgi:hypothetical protein
MTSSRESLLLLAVLPGLFWTGGPDTAAALHKAGLRPVAINEQALRSRVKLSPPGIDRKIQVASATTAPWVDANGWQIRRTPGREFYYDLPAGKAALAAAEAYTYDAKAILKIAPADLDDFASMMRFLRTLPKRNLPDVADFGFIDDGSDVAAEQLNLLARRNLLFKILSVPDPKLRYNVASNSDDPHLFAAKVREHITDEQRSLRVYGSEVVLCRLTGDGRRARVHVLNYGRNRLEGVRLRVRGTYAHNKWYGPGSEKPLDEVVVAGGFTEFSIPELETYAVIDLAR